MVLMANRGVKVEDVEKLLKERHKITGNKKVFHTRGEY
jgi:phosphoribosyl-ATP pyrophosphohydrolase/phosphoribosyl-AMP cyclohydrolase